ncbi:MAG TPA: T9SS type A sorting domain-containing protein [Chitinophagales bacterium]|nr:T9SS type A sorting domain-containing protein [Chitinophagales bacterium]
MKNKQFLLNALFASFLVSAVIFNSMAQSSCRVTRDSVIAGSNATSYSDYVYDNVSGMLLLVTHTDSGSFSSTSYDQVLYDGFGRVSEVRSFYSNPTPVLQRKITYVYTNDKVTRIEASGDNGSPWTLSHNVTYNGNDISSIVLDNTSITGSPEGFPGSFINMVWQNGNVLSLTLIYGNDSIELTAVYDDKNNISKKLLNTDGAGGFFEAANVNNILQVVTVYNETLMGNPVPAGTFVLDRDYTYNSNDDVETVTDNSALFNNQMSTTRYFWDCSVGIFSPASVSGLNIIPNPAADVIHLNQGNLKSVVKIFDMTGKQIKTLITDGQIAALDISDLKPGIYYIEANDGNITARGKVMKN